MNVNEGGEGSETNVNRDEGDDVISERMAEIDRILYEKIELLMEELLIIQMNHQKYQHIFYDKELHCDKKVTLI